MTACKVCSSLITKDAILCDGICGNSFHAACLKRASRSSSTAITTCQECSEIKPCHVLRLIGRIFDSFSSDHAVVAEKVAYISSNWANLQLFTDDLNNMNDKIDRLLTISETIHSNSTSLLERFHESRSKINCLSDSVDDLRSTLLSASAPGSGAAPLLPIVDDIRRSVRLVKGGIESLTVAASADSELIRTIASDVKALTQRGQSTCSSSGPNCGSSSVMDGSSVSPADAAQDSGRSSFDPLVPPSPRASPTLQPKRKERPRRKRRNNSVTLSGASQPVADVQASSGPSNSGDSPLLDVISLRPARRPRCVFVSRVHPETTEEDIIHHVSSCIGASRDVIACRKLGSSRGRGGCSFTASFKIFIPEDLFPAVVSSDTWPTGSIVREFAPRERPSITTSSSKNSSARSPSTMPT